MKVIKLIGIIIIAAIVQTLLFPFRLIAEVFQCFETVCKILKETLKHLVKTTLKEVFKTPRNGEKKQQGNAQ